MLNVPETYRIEDKYKTSMFLDTDESGNITEVISGRYIVPSRQYQYFFYVDRYVMDSISNYKVADGQLVVIDKEVENTVKKIYFAPTKEELEREKAEMEERIKLLEEQLATKQENVKMDQQ